MPEICPICRQQSVIEHNGGQWCSECSAFVKQPDSLTNIIKWTPKRVIAIFKRHFGNKNNKAIVLPSLIDHAETYTANQMRGRRVQTSKSKTTELLDAATSGNFNVVKALIEENPNLINYKNENGVSVLHRAAIQGSKIIVQYLIDNNAEVCAEDRWGKTPFIYAKDRGHDKVADLLFLHSQLEISNAEETIKIFNELAHEGKLFEVTEMVKRYPRLILSETYNSSNTTPLHAAASSGHVDVVQFLLDKGADINSKDQYGQTPLHDAADNGQKRMAKFLLDNGADVDARMHNDFTPLYMAADGGHRDVVMLLLRKGANVNARDASGKTIWLRMREKGKYDIAGLLKQHGGME